VEGDADDPCVSRVVVPPSPNWYGTAVLPVCGGLVGICLGYSGSQFDYRCKDFYFTTETIYDDSRAAP
jgi:hypothetical protein